MYIPNIHLIEDEDEIIRFILDNPFAIIVSEAERRIMATHVPVELEKDLHGNRVIRTHIAKANPQWKNFSESREILIIFNGPHTYISSSWYDHVNVPTWNYIAVHVYGKPKLLDREATIGVLDRLTKRYEQFSANPFDISRLSEQFMESHLKALVAFEVSIDRIDAKRKLSQNRNAENYDRIMDQLSQRSDEQSKAVVEEMKHIRQELFPEN
jgi:transcriptional regulator